MVGHSVELLLRIVPLAGKHADMVSKRFDNMQYIPVLYKEFAPSEIDIRDDPGRRGPFERGIVTITLYYRRHKPSIFET